jgi:hypothetical protein
MLSKLFTSVLLKVLSDEKLDAWAERVADKVAMKVISALADDLKKHL